MKLLFFNLYLIGEIAISHEALSFFNACRSDFIVTETIPKSPHHSKITMVEGNERCICYILPSNIQRWPSFYAMKQRDAKSCQLYFKRINDTNLPRFDETIKLLNKGRQVVSTGLSGIGKSTEINGLLIEFLKNMGTNGWPKEIWYRFDFNMIKFSLNNGNPHVFIISNVTLKSLLRLTLCIKDTVLLLELNENEINPLSYIPTYIPLSNRKVYDVTKQIFKANGSYMVVDPPFCEDLLYIAMCTAKFDVGLKVFEGKSDEDIKKMIEYRFKVVGPRLRDLFFEQNAYEAVVHHLKNNASKVFNCLKDVSVHQIPKDGSKYIGAFLKPGLSGNSYVPSLSTINMEMPCDFYEMKFLSEYICNLIAKVANEDGRSELINNNFDYQVAESIMIYALMDPSKRFFTENCWEIINWKWYENPSGNDMVGNKSLKEIPSLKPCIYEAVYDSTYLKTTVRNLNADTLYRSALHNGALVDAFTVSHDDQRVYAFQSSSKTPRDRIIKYSTMFDFMNNLEMFKNGYKLHYIYCYDNSSNNSPGIVFTSYEEDLKEKYKEEEYRKNQELVKNNSKILLARVHYYPNVAEIILNTTNKKK